MSTRVAVRLTIKFDVNAEVSGKEPLERALAEVTTSIQKQLHSGEALSPEIHINFLNARVDIDSMTVMNMGTGDMDK